MSFMILTRKELYDLVWSEPMMRLARRYGISDVGLGKICRKCDIPRPPRGYWAKKQVGKAPRQIRLPHPEEELKIELRDPADCRIVSPKLQNEVIQKISEEKNRNRKSKFPTICAVLILSLVKQIRNCKPPKLMKTT